MQDLISTRKFYSTYTFWDFFIMYLNGMQYTPLYMLCVTAVHACRYVVIWKKVDGNWCLYIDIFNSNNS